MPFSRWCFMNIAAACRLSFDRFILHWEHKQPSTWSAFGRVGLIPYLPGEGLGCKSNYKVRNKIRDHTCSIPSFHTCLKDPCRTSDPCVMIYIYIYLFNYVFIYIYVWTCVRICMSTHTYMGAYMQEYVYYSQALWLCWQVCACSTYSCYLLCCVMVGMCLAAASWQSKNGLLVTLPPSQPVAGCRLHHLQLLPAVKQLYNKDVVQMRSENERQPAWVASTCISLRCILYTLHIYI